jgi:Putative metallopeptidase
MKFAVATVAVIVTFLYPMAHARRASAQPPTNLQNSQIEIAYIQPRNHAYEPIYNRLRERKVLEELKQFLAPLRLPRKLTVQVDQCGATARPYASQALVTICYELLDQIEKVAGRMDPGARSSVIVGTFIEATLHEVAHAVFDILQFPIWGRRGDAADRLAALVMLQFGEDLAVRTITGTARFFTASEKTWTGSAFADVNSPEEQRFYNYLCIAFGGAPTSFAFLVEPDENNAQILPWPRARRCDGEYQQVRKAFDLRVMPFVDPDLLVTVRSMQWLVPSDIK